MSSTMIDAMVLIHACAFEKGTVDPRSEQWQTCFDCHWAVQQADHLAISAVAWAQIRRTNDATRALVLATWKDAIAVIPVDARVAERAAALYMQLRASTHACPTCLGLLPPQPCKSCGAQRSTQRATDDLLIAATADVTRGIDVLYSLDGGMLHLDGLCSGVRIVRPPGPHGPHERSRIGPGSGSRTRALLH